MDYDNGNMIVMLLYVMDTGDLRSGRKTWMAGKSSKTFDDTRGKSPLNNDLLGMFDIGLH